MKTMVVWKSSTRKETILTHQQRAIGAVRSFVDSTINKGEYPNGLSYKVYIVACSYILGNEKYWISTDIPDGKYFEVTYNATKNELYLDVYVRVHNEVTF